MNAPALETIELCKAFGGLSVADGISFRLYAGEHHALIGPNGAGKTSFVNLVTGQLHPSSGRILLNGKDVTHTKPYRRVRNGLCRTFQINSLFNGLSVLENIFLSIAEREHIGWKMVRSSGRYRKMLEEAHSFASDLGLETVSGQTVSTLSYGQQRLVEIAVALAQRPRVLLLDEPAAGVPSDESAVIFDVLERMPAALAVLLIEHDMDIVFRFAHRVTVLDHGRVVTEGTPQEIGNNDEVRRIYFGEGSLVDA